MAEARFAMLFAAQWRMGNDRTDEHLSRSFSSRVEQVSPKMFAVLQRARF